MAQPKSSGATMPSSAAPYRADGNTQLVVLHPHYEYLLQKSLELCRAGRILDFGCGKGLTVEEGRQRGLDIHGVEAFAEGSGTNIRDHLEESGMLGATVSIGQTISVVF